MFHVVASPSHVVLVAVLLSVQVGVYCLVHMTVPGVRAPLPDSKRLISSFI